MNKLIQDRYILIKVIGEGMYGKVYEASDIQNVHKKIAVKEVKKSEVRPKEIEIWKQIRGKYVVELIDCIEQGNYVYFVMEKCDNGNLQQFIENSQKPNEKQLTQYQILDLFYKIVVGYKESLLANNIIHRDLKPENIMIHEGNPKITDFGMTLKILNLNVQIEFSVTGTPKYAPPEAQTVERLGNYKFDIYSLGCILYFCLYSKTPQNPKNRDHLNNFFNNLKLYKTKAINFPNRNINRSEEVICQPIKDLIWKMIVFEQEQRLEIDEVLSHEAFKRNIFLNSRILQTTNLNQIQKLLDDKVNEYIQDKNVAYEKIYYSSNIAQQDNKQEIIDKYFQFIFNSAKFTLLVLNQFVQNFTKVETFQESDYIILYFIFFVDISFNYLLELLDDQCENMPNCLKMLSNSYKKYKKSNRMNETKQMILKEHEKWKILYQQLVKELQQNYEIFHKNSQTVLFQSFNPQMYYQALFEHSQRKQYNGDYCETILKNLIFEYFKKHPNFFSSEKKELYQGLVLIQAFLNKKQEINAQFKTFSFSSYYDSLQQITQQRSKKILSFD